MLIADLSYQLELNIMYFIDYYQTINSMIDMKV